MRRFLPALLVLALAGSALASSMTPADNYRPLRYVADDEGTQTDFAVTWPVEADADIIVKTSLDGGASWQTEALNTDYTVTGEGTDSVEVVFNVARAESELVFIDRNDGIDRTVDFTTITPTGLNLHLDRQVMQLQQVEDFAARRCVRIKDTDDYNEGEGGPVKDVELPTMTSVDGHAVVANDESDAFVWSAKSLGDWDCLTCPDSGDDDGICDGGENDGDACVDDSDCPGGNCDNGTCDGGTNDGQSCDTDEECPGGQCDPGLCEGGTNDGQPCASDYDCPDGYCGGDGNDGFTNCDYISTDATGTLVCEQGTCPDSCGGDGGGCITCGDSGVCSGGDNDGGRCLNDEDCPNGTCVFDDDVCYGGTGDGDPCTDDADCPGGGRCGASDDICLGGANDGDACTSDADCPGGVCVDDDDVCVGGANDGDLCDEDADCPGGTCDNDDNVCAGGANDGDPCTDDTDCPSGICIDSDDVCQGGTNDGDPCTDDADCPGGGTCDNRDGVGILGPDEDVTNNAVMRWDGITGKFAKNSRVILSDSGLMRGLFALQFHAQDSSSTSQSVIWSYPGYSSQADREEAAAFYNWPEKSPKWLGDNSFPGATQYVQAASDPDYNVVNGARTETFWSAATYPISVFQPGVSTNSQLVARIYFAEPVVCPDDWAGSEVWNATAFTASKTYNIQKNGSTVGTAVFDTDAGPNEAALLTSGGATSFAAGDYLDIDAPASADATGANLSFTLKCYKSIDDEVAQ